MRPSFTLQIYLKDSTRAKSVHSELHTLYYEIDTDDIFNDLINENIRPNDIVKVIALIYCSGLFTAQDNVTHSFKHEFNKHCMYNDMHD